MNQGEPLLWSAQQAAAVQRGLQAQQQLLWHAQQAAALQRGLQARLQLLPLADRAAAVQRRLQGLRFLAPGKLAALALRGHQWLLQPPALGGVTGLLQLLMPEKLSALTWGELSGMLQGSVLGLSDPRSQCLQPFHLNRPGALSAAASRQICPPAGACACRGK